MLGRAKKRLRPFCFVFPNHGIPTVHPKKPLTGLNVIRAAEMMALAGSKFTHTIVAPAIKKIVEDDVSWEETAMEKLPVPIALVAHLDSMVDVLLSMATLCKVDRIHSAGILSRSILESSRWARWIVYPGDNEVRVRRARACLVYRQKVRQSMFDRHDMRSGQVKHPSSTTRIRKEMRRDFGDDAYGAIPFDCMLGKIGLGEGYDLYRLSSAVSHNAVMLAQTDAALILCEAAYNFLCAAADMLKVREFPSGEFAAQFRDCFAAAGFTVLHEREKLVKKHGLSSQLPPDIAKLIEEFFGD